MRRPIFSTFHLINIHQYEGNLTTSFDLLSFYMNITPDAKNNTIVCFHPAHNWRRVYEDNIQQRIEECCEGGPYRETLEKQSHPVFVLLLFFWHLIYAWDQALDSLYPHINKLVSIYPLMAGSFDRFLIYICSNLGGTNLTRRGHGRDHRQEYQGSQKERPKAALHPGRTPQLSPVSRGIEQVRGIYPRHVWRHRGGGSPRF